MTLVTDSNGINDNNNNSNKYSGDRFVSDYID